MSLQDLPIELLDAICQNILLTDLVTLSRTSSFVYPVAQRLLYRHLSVSPASHNLAVVVTLSKRPDIARFVRSFAISLDAYSPVFPSFYRRLATALTHMSELTSLDLFIDASANWVLQAAAAASIYPRLLHFACSFPFDTHVVNFLNRSDALLELEVDSIPVSHPPPIPLLPLTSIPRLIQFTGSSQAAVAIVPGRPVESLHLNSGDLTEEDIERLSQSTSRIVVLGSTTTEQPVPLLESLSQKMPYLVYLRIMTMYTFSKAPDAAFYEQVAQALTGLPDLTAFELSGMHWGSRKKSDDGDKRIWQSKPLSTDFGREEDIPDLDLYSDIYSDSFVVY